MLLNNGGVEMSDKSDISTHLVMYLMTVPVSLGCSLVDVGLSHIQLGASACVGAPRSTEL